MCPAATPAPFGDASWAKAGVATIATRVSVSRSCFFMSVLYQRRLKNALERRVQFSTTILLLLSAPSAFVIALRQLRVLMGSNEIAYAGCPALREKIVPHVRSSRFERTLRCGG